MRERERGGDYIIHASFATMFSEERGGSIWTNIKFCRLVMGTLTLYSIDTHYDTTTTDSF